MRRSTATISKKFNGMSSRICILAIVATSLSMVAEVADAQVSLYDGCDGACVFGGGEFCGVDEQCHNWSCQEWYQYGPQNFTGYNDSSELTCQDIAVTEPGSDEVFYSSVSFRCRSLTPPPIQMGFTRKCTANRSQFTCYELADDTDFSLFLAAAEASDLNCTDDEYDETGYPKFTYNVLYEYSISGAGYSVSMPGFNGTSEFMGAMALGGSMLSSYTESQTEAPTTASSTPTTPGPTPSPTSGSFRFANKIIYFFVFFTAVPLV